MRELNLSQKSMACASSSAAETKLKEALSPARLLGPVGCAGASSSGGLGERRAWEWKWGTLGTTKEPKI